MKLLFCTFESRIISESSGACVGQHSVPSDYWLILINVTSGSVNSVSPRAEQSLVLSLYCTSRPMFVSGSKTAKLKSRSKNCRNSLGEVYVGKSSTTEKSSTSQGLQQDAHWCLIKRQPAWHSWTLEPMLYLWTTPLPKKDTHGPCKCSLNIFSSYKLPCSWHWLWDLSCAFILPRIPSFSKVAATRSLSCSVSSSVAVVLADIWNLLAIAVSQIGAINL